eukprot:TRINITY_DN2052_c0_g1_i3.p2 TRINITY_DN2052_c0_g1~~TRINITY_DN2052_c0_g1_i3.p2  ORF type:complete len:200 (+),score=67.26 TRINITY_DN2052_c0_g1_i3:63-662(+)
MGKRSRAERRYRESHKTDWTVLAVKGCVAAAAALVAIVVFGFAVVVQFVQGIPTKSKMFSAGLAGLGVPCASYVAMLLLWRHAREKTNAKKRERKKALKTLRKQRQELYRRAERERAERGHSSSSEWETTTAEDAPSDDQPAEKRRGQLYDALAGQCPRAGLPGCDMVVPAQRRGVWWQQQQQQWRRPRTVMLRPTVAV